MLREGLRALHRGVEAGPSGWEEDPVETGVEARSGEMPGAGLQQGRSAFAPYPVPVGGGRGRGSEPDRTLRGAPLAWGAHGARAGTARIAGAAPVGIGGGRRGSAAARVRPAGAGASRAEPATRQAMEHCRTPAL